MRWLWAFVVLGSIASCSKHSSVHRTGSIPDGFIQSGCSTSAECDDGNPCTDDSCSGQQCVNSPKDCKFIADDCNAADCDVTTGSCIPKPAHSGDPCNTPNLTAGTCADGVCNELPTCTVGQSFLDCDASGNTVIDTTVGSSSIFDTYSCASGETGPEISYPLFVFNDGTVTVSLSDTTADLDLIVLEGSDCMASAKCVKSSTTVGTGKESVTFEASAAKSYMVLVEGRDGASSAFKLHTSCTGCQPVQALDCNMSYVGDTSSPSAVNALSSYDCAPNTPGPEISYSLTPSGTTDYTLRLTGLTKDLDMVVLLDDGNGLCDTSVCLNDHTDVKSGNQPETATFTGLDGVLHYVVIDSKGAGGPFMLEVDCKQSCLGHNHLFGCDDGSDSGRSDDPVKSTNLVNDWACDANTTGREVIYHFTPDKDGTYTFTLSGLEHNLDLVVVEPMDSTSCDPSMACVTSSTNGTTADDTTPEVVHFAAQAHHDYYIAVDGKLGAASPYRLRISSDKCDPWSCSSLTSTLSCSAPEDRRSNGDFSKSKNVVDNWACDAQTTGPEVVYRFDPPKPATYTVTLDELDADLDLIVLPSSTLACDPTAACLANPRPSPSPSPVPSPSPGSYAPESVTFTTLSGKTYYIVVDGKRQSVGNYHISFTGGNCP